MSASFSEEQLKAFFFGVGSSIGRARQRFSPFEYFRPGEVPLSRVMADLLSPEGSHGYGDRLLAAFLVLIAETRFGDTTKMAKVEVNDRTEEGRLIDITVSSEPFILGIENKPWAREGREQVKDYLRELKKRETANGYVLLYLSGDGSSPPSLKTEEIEILTKDNRLKVLRYWTILNSWLEDCEKECLGDEGIELRMFLGFFRRYVAAREEAQMLAEYIFKDESGERLRIALAVAKSADEVRDRVIRAFAADISQALAPDLGEKAEIVETLKYKKFTGIYLRMPTWSYSVAIESQGPGCEFIFGVRDNETKPTADPKFPALVARLADKLGRGESSEDWEWFDYLKAPYGRGHSADDVVLEIYGNRARALQFFSDRIREVFEVTEIETSPRP
jgi:hypothetical protein